MNTDKQAAYASAHYVVAAWIGVCGALTFLATSASSAPLGTEFTYQGQLVQNGSPVNGLTTLRFSLWNAVSSGSQIGASQLLANVAVAGGLFTVQLNGAGQFGATAWNGDARWLQVEVCADPACSASTPLSPRQPVTAAPYARHSASPWVKNGSALSYDGNVGVGTDTPSAKLDVRGDVKLGPAGQYFATAGEEKLRMIRGTVDGDGNILQGSGFTVLHYNQGAYLITFDVPFVAAPTVTATAMLEWPVIHALLPYSPTTQSFEVFTLSGDDATTLDKQFQFIALGPR